MKYLLSGFLFFYTTTISLAQTAISKPQQVVTAIFSGQLQSFKSYVCCEQQYLKPEDFKNIKADRIELLAQYTDKAVVSVQLSNPNSEKIDYYIYLIKKPTWKIRAVRTLALPAFAKNLIQHYKSSSKESLEDFFKMKTGSTETPESFEDFLAGVEAMKLMVETDENLVTHFLKHQSELERLLNLSRQQKTKNSISKDSADTTMKALFATTITRTIAFNEICLHSVKFLIDGILDNSVGYLYIEPGAALPEMNPNELILLKKITDNWYLYKTT